MREREKQKGRELKSTKLSSDKLATPHRHNEPEEGQWRINGCALIDKLIKQTNNVHSHENTDTM